MTAAARITQIDHIGAPVWDADGAVAFYDHADIPIVLDDVIEDFNIRAVFLDFDGVYLEFLEPIGAGTVKTFLERHGPGYHHVAYRVPDIEATMAALRAVGIEFQSDEPLLGAGESRIVFVEERHTNGFPVELVERNG